jgi:hypothetical protein
MNKNKQKYNEIFKLYNDRRIASKAIDELELLAIKGKRFCLPDIMDLLFNPEKNNWSPDEQFIAKYYSKRWIYALRRRFLKKGIWFGVVNTKHQYGFCETIEEKEFVKEQELKRQKGLIKKLFFIEDAYEKCKRLEKMN